MGRNNRTDKYQQKKEGTVIIGVSFHVGIWARVEGVSLLFYSLTPLAIS